jgi:hypothetical protein
VGGVARRKATPHRGVQGLGDCLRQCESDEEASEVGHLRFRAARASTRKRLTR